MIIYDMLNEIESVDNKSFYGVEPLSYVALGCAK